MQWNVVFFFERDRFWFIFVTTPLQLIDEMEMGVTQNLQRVNGGRG